MTPNQLERIKAYQTIIAEHFRVQDIDPDVGKFIDEAINEKLARTEHQLTYFANQNKTGPLPADLFPPKIVVTEPKPIQLKNLKDPEWKRC